MYLELIIDFFIIQLISLGAILITFFFTYDVGNLSPIIILGKSDERLVKFIEIFEESIFSFNFFLFFSIFIALVFLNYHHFLLTSLLFCYFSSFLR